MTGPWPERLQHPQSTDHVDAGNRIPAWPQDGRYGRDPGALSSRPETVLQWFEVTWMEASCPETWKVIIDAFGDPTQRTTCAGFLSILADFGIVPQFSLNFFCGTRRRKRAKKEGCGTSQDDGAAMTLGFDRHETNWYQPEHPPICDPQHP